jgi:oligopeptide/dipeptide ABC transporter ATP-binding protein
MNKILEIKNLSISFQTANGRLRAVDNISFSLEKGERLGIIGESGSGKSVTALSILNIIEEIGGQIDSGKILYHNEDILTMPKKKVNALRGSEIAYISQDPANSLNPIYTIKDQLMEIFTIHHIRLTHKEKMRKIKHTLEMLDFTHVDSLLRKYPFELSGGMCQRIVIAMALLLEAEIIIADEPTTALDVSTQANILELFDIISEKNNCAIILISHDIGVIHDLSDRVLVLYYGKIMEEQKSVDFFKNPRHPYTKSLIQALPKNFSGRFQTLKNAIPDIYHGETGCQFFNRCDEALPMCSMYPPTGKQLSLDGICFCHNIVNTEA